MRFPTIARYLVLALAAACATQPGAAPPFDAETLAIERRGRAVAEALRDGRGLQPLGGAPAELARADLEPVCADRQVLVEADRDPVTGAVTAFVVPLSEEVWFVGGWQRVTLSADGSEVLSITPLSAGCFRLAKAPDDDIVAFFTTQIVAGTPTENHVAVSLLLDEPLYVMNADEETFKVFAGEISEVDF